MLRAGGQSVVTATELGHVPGAEEPGVERVAIAEGRVLQAAATTSGRRDETAAGTAAGELRARCVDGARWRPRRCSPRSSGRGRRRPATAFAPHAEPFRERDGEVFVACGEAVRAQELDLMSELVVERLNTALGRPAVRRLRVQAKKVAERPG